MSAAAAGARAPAPSELEELADHCLSIIESCVHTILSARGVYPAASFERRRAFGVSTPQSRHPGVCAAVSAPLAAARAPLLAGHVEACVLLLTDAASGAPIEQYVFDCSLTGAASPAAGGARLAATPATYADLDASAAAALLRLGALALPTAGVPPPPPTGTSTWMLLLRTHEVLNAAHGGVLAGTAAGGTALWARVDEGDDEAALSAPAAAAAAAASQRKIKHIRAGALAIDISACFAASGLNTG